MRFTMGDAPEDAWLSGWIRCPGVKRRHTTVKAWSRTIGMELVRRCIVRTRWALGGGLQRLVLAPNNDQHMSISRPFPPQLAEPCDLLATTRLVLSTPAVSILNPTTTSKCANKLVNIHLAVWRPSNSIQEAKLVFFEHVGLLFVMKAQEI